jgi:hypothetical protein
MGFWDDLNKKLASYVGWIEEKRETEPKRFPRLPFFRWPPKPEPKPAPVPEPLEEDVEYDSTGRIISVPEGWEVEFTGTISGYTGGKDNEVSEERITLYGAPGEITEAELMENYDGKLYWGGSEVLELSSFSERAVEI